MTFAEASLPQGTLVVLRIDDLEGLECTVRWAIGNQAGLEFARRIYGPVMDHVRRKHGLAVRIEPA